MLADIQNAVASGHYEMGPHAAIRQNERGILTDEIELAIGNDEPEILGDYPGDPRGPCCLIRGEARGGVLHAICTATDPVFIISVYWPDPAVWEQPDFRKRRSS